MKTTEFKNNFALQLSEPFSWRLSWHKVSLLSLLLVCSLTLFASRTYADNQQNTVSELSISAAEQLLQQLALMPSLHVRFKQRLLGNKGETLDESQGRLLWMRPDFFRWDISQPYEQSIVVKHSKQYQYDKDLEQLTVQQLDEQAIALPSILLANDTAQLNQHFTVRKLQSDSALEATTLKENHARAQALSSQLTAYELKPVEANAEILAFILWFDKKQLSSIHLLDSLQQISEFTLEHVLDAQLDQTDFEFALEPDVEVIELN